MPFQKPSKNPNTNWNYRLQYPGKEKGAREDAYLRGHSTRIQNPRRDSTEDWNAEINRIERSPVFQREEGG
uniref:Uncharacterized protein n=1 Tax=Anopheles atroparvus TaxID=41427 RepID=A0AAG5DIK4_ANOAO